MKNEKNYLTKDIYLASTLYAFGFRIIETEWQNGACFFVFKDEGGCKELIAKYYMGDLQEDPKKLFDAFKTIKEIIYQK